MGKKKKKKKDKKKAEEREGGEEPGDEAKKEDAGAGAEAGTEAEAGAAPAAAPEGVTAKKEEGEKRASAVGDRKEKEPEKEKADDAGSDEDKGKTEKRTGRVPPLHNYTLDLTCLTPDEEKTLKNVLERDEGETRPIKDHVQILKNELDLIHRGFRKKPGDKPQCVNCRKKFGLWRYLFPGLYLGKRCQRCRHKTCKRCIHKQANGRYMCGTCVRLREIKHLTGEWMVPPATRLHSSDLIRVSLRDKEKYKALHASREKKKNELLAKLNALHGKGADTSTGGDAGNALSMWSATPSKEVGEEEDKEKKSKKDKKKKDKKKKKKKNKAANNAIPSPDSIDLNASFLEAARIAESIAKEEEERISRAERHVRTSSSSSTVDSSSDSKGSSSSSNGASGGGGFSSGYESCERQRIKTQGGQARRERHRNAEPCRETERKGVGPANDGEFETLRDVAEGRGALYHGEDNYNKGAEGLTGKLARQLCHGEKGGDRRGYYDLTEGRWVENCEGYRMKVDEKAKEKKSRWVDYKQDLFIDDDQRIHLQEGRKGKLSEFKKRNVSTDNLVFDDFEGNIEANFSPPKTDKDSEAKHYRARQKQSKVKALADKHPERNENRYEQTQHKKSVVGKSRSIYPSSSYVYAKDFLLQSETVQLREGENNCEFIKPTRGDRTKDKHKRSSSRHSMVGVSRTICDDERVKRKEKIGNERKLSPHTYIVASPHKAQDVDRYSNLFNSKNKKKFVKFENSEGIRSSKKFLSEKEEKYKTTKQNHTERQRRCSHAVFNTDNFSTPSPLQEFPTKLRRKLKERSENEMTYTSTRNSKKDHPAKVLDTTSQSGQKLPAAYLEPFDMAEIDISSSKGIFYLSKANLALHTAAVAKNKPKASCLSHSKAERVRRAGTSAELAGVRENVNHEEARPKGLHSPRKNEAPCKASLVRFSSVQRNKSPGESLGSRLKKSLVNALDIPDY